MNIYIIAILRDQKPPVFKVHRTKHDIFSSRLYRELEKIFEIRDCDDWKVYPIDKPIKIKRFANQLAESIEGLVSMYNVIHEEEVNKNQIPLPLEGEN